MTFADIVDETRRIYAGMLFAMDVAVEQVVKLFEGSGLYNNTVLVFTTDNGGIGPGSNFPLRGSKVCSVDTTKLSLHRILFFLATMTSSFGVRFDELIGVLIHCTLYKSVEMYTGTSLGRRHPRYWLCAWNKFSFTPRTSKLHY